MLSTRQLQRDRFDLSSGMSRSCAPGNDTPPSVGSMTTMIERGRYRDQMLEHVYTATKGDPKAGRLPRADLESLMPDVDDEELTAAVNFLVNAKVVRWAASGQLGITAAGVAQAERNAT
jgi:hypothetical protein